MNSDSKNKEKEERKKGDGKENDTKLLSAPPSKTKAKLVREALLGSEGDRKSNSGAGAIVINSWKTQSFRRKRWVKRRRNTGPGDHRVEVGAHDDNAGRVARFSIRDQIRRRRFPRKNANSRN